ncbi:MAG: hypothetical protein WDN48_20645 [Pseudolabrys sp.]
MTSAAPSPISACRATATLCRRKCGRLKSQFAPFTPRTRRSGRTSRATSAPSDLIDHPTEGHIPYLVDPLAKAGLSDPTRRPSPALGQHTEEVLRGIGAKAG